MKHQQALPGAVLLLLSFLFLTMCGRPETGVVAPTTQPAAISTPTALPSTPTDLVPVPTVGNPIGEDTIRPSMLIPVQEAAATANIYQSYPDYGLIVQYQTQIADPSISEAYRTALRQALESEMRAAERRATEIALAPRTLILPTLQPTPLGGIYPTPEMPRGILEFDSTLLGIDESVTRCTDPMWQEAFDPLVVRIAACFSVPEPNNSFLLLISFPYIQAPGRPYPKLINAKVLIPGKVGPVRITASQGHQITLQANDGSTFVFDADTLQFVTSMTGTVTPIAPSIPTPIETTAPVVGATPAPAP